VREVDELAGQQPLLHEGIHRELLMQADSYHEKHREKCPDKELIASSASVDSTNSIRKALRHCAGFDATDESIDKGMIEVKVSDFLSELGKTNRTLAEKLSPVLSWVTSIGVKGDNIELRFDCKGEEKEGKPQWLREGTLAADIKTHGLFIPKVLRAHFVEQAGKTKLVGLKGLEISATVSDVPINIDRIGLRSTSISVSGERLRFDVEAKNPAPFLSKFLPAHKRRPDPISSVVLVDDQGNLEMYESWKKSR